jgi:hypothetical protein
MDANGYIIDYVYIYFNNFLKPRNLIWLPGIYVFSRITVLPNRENQRSGDLVYMDTNGYIIDYVYIYFSSF